MSSKRGNRRIASYAPVETPPKTNKNPAQSRTIIYFQLPYALVQVSCRSYFVHVPFNSSILKEDKILPKASDLKQGSAIEINGEPYAVKKIEVRNPTSRGASTLYKIRFAHMKTRQKLDDSFKGDDFLKEADCAKLMVQYSYHDGESYTFMNLETYEQ